MNPTRKRPANPPFGLRAAMICLVGASLLATSKCAWSQGCTRKQAIEAESHSDGLKTWQDAHLWYRRYRQCDDGAISEGYSSSIGNLLADRWSQFSRLVSLVAADHAFGPFILKHINQTLTLDQGKAIRRNVRFRCPKNDKRFCGQIDTQLTRAGLK